MRRSSLGDTSRLDIGADHGAGTTMPQCCSFFIFAAASRQAACGLIWDVKPRWNQRAALAEKLCTRSLDCAR
jgi:hypothetical protein